MHYYWHGGPGVRHASRQPAQEVNVVENEPTLRVFLGCTIHALPSQAKEIIAAFDAAHIQLEVLHGASVVYITALALRTERS